jgi:hypothetical protein
MEMFRRKFLELVTLAGAGGLAPLHSLASEATETVICRVRGFSCITCAIGLDALLGHQKGVKSSKSTYPEGIVKVSFNPDQVTEEWIVAFITDVGFSVTDKAKG